MKTTGPSPIPTKLKIVKGTNRADRGAVNEAEPPAGIPECPAHLTGEARVEWDRISQLLYTCGLLTHVDRAALAGYCDVWADYVDASLKVQTMGVVVTTKTQKQLDGTITGGNIIENPYYSIKKRSLELMYRYLTEFGMSPASRSRIEANPPADAKPASRWAGFSGK